MNDFAYHAARLIGVESVTLSRFAHGDLSAVMRAETTDGEAYIVKAGPDPVLEGEMLQLIAATGAPAPKVIAADEAMLIMEQIPGQSGFSGVSADFARVLTLLHHPSDRPYGFHRDFAFGRVPIRNAQTRSWVAFWRDNRLMNNLSDLPSSLARRIEKLGSGLADIIPDTPPAALLHGDLWAGNVMSDGGRVTALIDPACYYGHCEVDLAMAALFGHLDAAFFAHYPKPEQGLDQRLAVYSLWPALVHLKLFGSGYRSMVEGFLNRSGY